MTRADIQQFIAKPDISVVQAMKKIDENGKGILYIIDEDDKLCGCITDGDIRRFIIKTGRIEGLVSEFMNHDPIYLFESEMANANKILKKWTITSVPILTKKRDIVQIIFKEEKILCDSNEKSDVLKDVPIVIMAGGKGTRLYPYTKILPKPLIPIGEIPILERILNCFFDYGAREFYITVNYKKEMIKSYFRELNAPYTIHFVEETKPLGTAGSIHLIETKFSKPVIVTNCDVLIEADFQKLLEHHLHSQNEMTIVSSLKNTVIPYGVLHFGQEGVVSSMEEKPQLPYFINTGMYIVNPKHLEKIPSNTVYHMPQLAEQLIAEDLRVGVYPISEDSFLDMGQFEEMKKMEEKLNSKELS